MRTRWQWCPIQKKVVETHLAGDVSVLANVRHGYIPDEMPETKHPVTGEYYTSKSKFRATTKALGYEEVGTAYERGYDPSVRREESFKGRLNRIRSEIRERLKG